MNEDHLLNYYLSEKVRAWLEQRYYAQVNAQATFDHAIHDPDFWRGPAKHVALFSDHGVVHVRDVAHQILQVLDAIHGVLIPDRARHRLDFFMRGYGVMAAYLHDIGMADFSAFGRAMHPEFAAQAVFTPEFDKPVETIWAENCGNVAWRLMTLSRVGALEQAPEIVLRELLALSACHSKSKVPVAVLNGPVALRALMQASVGTHLRRLYEQQQAVKGKAIDPSDLPADQPPPPLHCYYADFERESFRWLISDRAEVRELVQDAVDTLRALRCADALRQRGTVQKTSGGYEVFVNQMESVDDNPGFADLVLEQLRQMDVAVAARTRTVPSLQHASDLERNRYLEAAELDWDLSRRQAALDRIALSGHKTETIDPAEGFRHVKLATLRTGETLIEAGAPASFVYFPLGDGLRIIPLGGYQSFSVRAWMPLGNTGVIRGAIRNANIVADREVSLLIIPKEIYLRHWHNPYTVAELKQLLSAGHAL